MVTDNHVRIGAVDNDATPLNASETGLGRWADVARHRAQGRHGARKAQALEVRGTAGAVVPIDTELTHSSGLRYRVTAAVTIPVAGLTYADVEAIDTGPSTQLSAGRRGASGRHQPASSRQPAWCSISTMAARRRHNRLTQTARFRSRGLFGLLYWYAVLPFHGIVFRGMLGGIRRFAENVPRADGPAPAPP
jgi:hypothetical protein